jgi:hypothetical protein
MITQCYRIVLSNKNKFWKPLLSVQRWSEGKSAYFMSQQVIQKLDIPSLPENNKCLTNLVPMLYFLWQHMIFSVWQICLPKKVTMIVCIIIKCNLQVTTCSWPPYFKITFPVHILRNDLLWSHFTLSYEFLSIFGDTTLI